MKPYSKLFLTLLLIVSALKTYSQSPEREYYELKIYHIENESQEQLLDNYLENAFLPALKRSGIARTGVFKPVKGDSLYQKAIYVFIPYQSLQEYLEISEALNEDPRYIADGEDYIDAPHDNPPYRRMETILLKAFKGMPQFEQSNLTNSSSEKIYELRSYESATEKLFRNKVKMFDEGEITIFKKLDFNPVFFGEVIAGGQMPNLMYLTTHANRDVQEEHWQAFGEDKKWKEMSAMEEYKNNVSHIDITLLHPTEYSGI